MLSIQRLKCWSDEAVETLGLSWDGERVVFPNGARYLPGGNPKMLQPAGVQRDLFPAPESVSDSTVWICEGEPDCVSLWSLGLPAVAVPGAAAWRDEWAQRFSGKHVVVVTDCDQPGRDLAARLAGQLVRCCKTVRVLDLGGEDGYDVGDLIAENEGSLGRLLRLAEKTEPVPPKLRIRRMSSVKVSVKGTEWLWHGLVAKGAITVLAGQPKVGKSTLLFGLLAGPERLLGRGVRAQGALLLSEERDASLAEKALMFGVDAPHVLCRCDVQGMRWPEVVEESVHYMQLHGLDMLVIDTFDKWGGHDENHPGAVVQALEPLIWAAGQGVGVLLVHHQRKGGGQFGDAVRGSNALTGGVDVVVELERLSSLRVLRCVSRFRDTPDEVIFKLSECEFGFVFEEVDVFSPEHPLFDASELMGEFAFLR